MRVVYSNVSQSMTLTLPNDFQVDGSVSGHGIRPGAGEGDLLRTSSLGHAARRATTTIPIVMVAAGDPVRGGLVASLARPGGNITGMTFLSRELAAKRLEILKETVPTVSRVAILWNPDNPGGLLTFKATQAAAEILRLTL